MTTFNTALLATLVALAGAAWWLWRRWKADAAAHKREFDELKQRHADTLHAHTARMEAMLDSMIEGLIVLDARGRITLVNRAAERIFGFSRMMAGGTLLEAIRHHEVAALAARVNAEGSVVQHELRLESPAARVLQISAVALHDANDAPAGAVLVAHDVTQLRELEGVRQDFVANVSYELRTPLSLIKSAAETLIDGGKDDPAALTRFLEIIDKHANRLTLLIDDLLLLARLDSGRIELRFEAVPLRAAVQDTVDDYQLKAAARGVVLENAVPPGLAARADAERLRQVLSNLVDNAIKYGRENGRVTVSGRALDAGRVELCVRDDGPGIPPEAKVRVFERFFRVDKARSREQGGTGLGLAIVKNVVQAHGGEVRVESAPGEGTVFFLTLPAAPID
ncbi:MAG: PAS domain-containing protein [Verrucomicrobia bacterium]|nr:PAS domain-containing protein [Verrucomicrobiota bacterium]